MQCMYIYIKYNRVLFEIEKYNNNIYIYFWYYRMVMYENRDLFKRFDVIDLVSSIFLTIIY